MNSPLSKIDFLKKVGIESYSELAYKKYLESISKYENKEFEIRPIETIVKSIIKNITDKSIKEGREIKL